MAETKKVNTRGRRPTGFYQVRLALGKQETLRHRDVLQQLSTINVTLLPVEVRRELNDEIVYRQAMLDLVQGTHKVTCTVLARRRRRECQQAS